MLFGSCDLVLHTHARVARARVTGEIHLTQDVKATGQEQKHTAHDHPRRPTWRRLVFPPSVSGCFVVLLQALASCSDTRSRVPKDDLQMGRRHKLRSSPPPLPQCSLVFSAVFP